MIYLDNNATTQVALEVFEAMQPYLTTRYGNPSSAHALGRSSRAAAECAREEVADLLGARSADEIVFTSCGSESNNWAIGGFLEQNPHRRHVITTQIEHRAVLDTASQLEKQGWRVTRLPADSAGVVDLDRLDAALDDETTLVSVMLMLTLGSGALAAQA